MGAWIWIAVVALFVIAVAILTTVACFLLLRRSRNKQCHKGQCCQETGQPAINVKLPLPTSNEQEMENSMEATQHSDMELPSRHVSSKSNPFRSSCKETSKSERSSTRPSNRIHRDTKEALKMSRSSHHPPVFNEDALSSITSSCAQHSTEEHHVLNTHPLCENGNCHSSSTTCTGPSVPVSAGCTPRYARKFSTTTSQVTVPVRKSLLDTPTKNVSTAHEMFGIHSHSAQAVRSEMIANIDAEDAGRTPIQLSPLPITKKTTDDQSRMTTWTPSKMSEGGGSPAGKPI